MRKDFSDVKVGDYVKVLKDGALHSEKAGAMLEIIVVSADTLLTNQTKSIQKWGFTTWSFNQGEFDIIKSEDVQSNVHRESLHRPMEFKIGDKVEFGGLSGTVIERLSPVLDYPILVSFNNHNETRFTLDGRLETFHTKPLLNLISRPKKKVKKQFKGWMNVYKDGVVDLYNGPRTDYAAVHDDCQIVEFTGEYEIEEEED